jgi:hypothetical protein
MAFADIPQPTTIAERLALARRTCAEFELPEDFWIDGLDDQSRAMFGDLPSPALIIRPDGTVAAKLPWSEPEPLGSRIETVLAELIDAAEDREAEPRLVDLLWRANRGDAALLRAAPRPISPDDGVLWALGQQRHGAPMSLSETASILTDSCRDQPERLAAALAALVAEPRGSAPADGGEAILRQIEELAGERRPRQAAWARARMRNRAPL